MSQVKFSALQYFVPVTGILAKDVTGKKFKLKSDWMITRKNLRTVQARRDLRFVTVIRTNMFQFEIYIPYSGF